MSGISKTNIDTPENRRTFINENFRFRISFLQKLLDKIDENYDNFCKKQKIAKFLRKCERYVFLKKIKIAWPSGICLKKFRIYLNIFVKFVTKLISTYFAKKLAITSVHLPVRDNMVISFSRNFFRKCAVILIKYVDITAVKICSHIR